MADNREKTKEAEEIIRKFLTNLKDLKEYDFDSIFYGVGPGKGLEIGQALIKKLIEILDGKKLKPEKWISLKEKERRGFLQKRFEEFEKLPPDFEEKVDDPKLEGLLNDAIGEEFYAKLLDLLKKIRDCLLKLCLRSGGSQSTERKESPSSTPDTEPDTDAPTDVPDNRKSLVLVFGKSKQTDIETLKKKTELTEAHQKILKTYEWFWYGCQTESPQMSSCEKSGSMFWLQIDFSSDRPKEITNYLEISDLLGQLSKNHSVSSITCGGPFEYAVLTSKGFHRA